MAENQEKRKYYTLPVDTVVKELQSDPEAGLSPSDVQQRQQKWGPNRIAEAKSRSVWKILVDQFKSIVLIILLVAAGLAVVFAQWAEALAILAVLIINGLIGFVSEWRAIKSMEALRSSGKQFTRVLREGQEQKIAGAELVPGDIVLIDSGDVAPADCRIIESNRMQVDESMLTGESVPVIKRIDPVEEDATIAERVGMLYKGTTITEGSGVGIVTATGERTQLGRIAQMTGAAEDESTPLKKRLEQLGRRLAWITLSVAVVIAVVGVIQGKPALKMIETAIALGVAAIPEGLPIVATIALARGMWLMARRQALINQLTAVETLGTTDVICTDKTGTITENRMTLHRIVTPDQEFDLTNDEYDEQNPHLQRVLELGVLCANASIRDEDEDGVPEESLGDPTEVALLKAGLDHSMTREQLLEKKPEQREVSFNPDTMMMATFNRSDDQLEVNVKGAPDAVLDKCTQIGRAEGEAEPLSDEERAAWNARAEDLAGEGLRVLAAAEKQVDSTEDTPYESLQFLGLFGLKDPPRKGMTEAIAACQSAGIRVIMITGDQRATAAAVAAEVGMLHNSDRVFSGRDLAEKADLTDHDRSRILQTEVFYRISPGQKLMLTEVFQDAGHVVAMTGDGVNDAPALKTANIGVAMGKRGTDAAREAADMVLKDDAFSSIVAAVEQGRIIFGNIRASAMFMLCTNIAEVMAVGFAAIANLPLPLHVLQILYLNVITDVFPALALSVGPGPPNVMEDKPRHEALLTRRHWLAICTWGLIMAACVMAGLAIGFQTDIVPEGDPAVTISFLTLAFAKLFFVFNLRDVRAGMFKNEITGNRWIWVANGICVLLLIAAVYMPGLSNVLRTRPLPAAGWLTVLCLALIPLIAGQAWLAFRKHLSR